MASAASSVPSSLVAVPSDVLKKRIMIRNETLIEAFRMVLRAEGVKGFFIGWQVLYNLFEGVSLPVTVEDAYVGESDERYSVCGSKIVTL